MASISSLSNPDDHSQRKRRKLNNNNSIQNNPIDTIDHTRWRTESEHQIYSSNLFHALRNNNNKNRGKAVREVADQVLAIRARGRTRWSRAIITSRVRRRRIQVNVKHKRAKVNVTLDSRLKKEAKPKKKKKVGGVEEKVSLLGRLVPGCRNLAFPKFLEETADYIAALEMQVRAMTALTQILTGEGGGVATTPPLPPV